MELDLRIVQNFEDFNNMEVTILIDPTFGLIWSVHVKSTYIWIQPNLFYFLEFSQFIDYGHWAHTIASKVGDM